MKKIFLVTLALISACSFAQEKFDYMDVFQLEWISDPQISPCGQKIIYVRNYNDVMTDQGYSNLWIINFDGTDNRPLTTGNHNDLSPRWSPDGKRVLYKSNKDGSLQLYLRWLDNGSEAKLTNSKISPGTIVWSPDGKLIAFDSFVEESDPPLVSLPSPPEGARWASPPKYIDRMNYRYDGAGYLKEGNNQLFILSVDGGTPYQVTSGKFNHDGDFCWTSDSKFILVSANRHDDHEFDPLNYEIYEVNVQDKSIKALTSRQGPDFNPAVSPDGKLIAYTGFDDRYQAYQLTNLYVMNRDGSSPRQVIKSLDRDVINIKWSSNNKGIYFQYDDKGNTWIAYADLKGNVTKLTDNVGGGSLDRPYEGGSFTVSVNGRFAFTCSSTDRPSDLASGSIGTSEIKLLTAVNDDLFIHKKPGKAEELWYSSSFDKRNIQGWILYPPDFDASKKYPLILEIHGGPLANYGLRFSVEMQLYAANDYVVLYTNPRGSTSYGEEFGNLIHLNYPGQDYDDLMSGVDAIIAKGFIDDKNLFVTGGSGGGILSAWIVGHTSRFKAAVVAKPIVNWYSCVLYSDSPGLFYKYWFPAFPWDNPEHYMNRSPITYVKYVKTPTMILTGENDYRTPIAEIEQYYEALKLNKVETAMVRIQDASHDIAARPSNEINKVKFTLGWFDKFKNQ
ncbi:MAG TPA: peptidase S9 family protein [Bacteroidales bacterium]|nr:peptidase S9 family protein [Bacteroidales bacterium]